MPIDKIKEPENKPMLVKPNFQKCACQSCTIAGQFASPGWLCEFHRDAPPQYWPFISQKYKQFKALYKIYNELKVTDRFNSYAMTNRLKALGYSDLLPLNTDSSYHLAQRIFGYLFEQIVTQTIHGKYLPAPDYPSSVPPADQSEEPYVYEDNPFF